MYLLVKDPGWDLCRKRFPKLAEVMRDNQCYYNEHDMISLAFQAGENVAIKEIYESNNWNTYHLYGPDHPQAGEIWEPLKARKKQRKRL